jgi:hypothetical protein
MDDGRMYRGQTIESRAELPQEARIWARPCPSENPLDGWEHDPWESVEPPLGDFVDTEILETPSWVDVADVLANESTLFVVASTTAKTDAQFDEILDALEFGDVAGLDPALARVAGDHVDGAPALEYPLEIGVAAVTLALNAVGLQTRASCRGHGFGWAPHPVVYFVATDEGLAAIADSVARAGCGFGVDSERANLVYLEAPAIPAFLHLARLLTDLHEHPAARR